VKRATYRRVHVQIRVIADDPETVLKLLKKIVESLGLENASITGVYPNRKEPGYRGYLLGDVYDQ